jgi:serine/threonine-protein kinase
MDPSSNNPEHVPEKTDVFTGPTAGAESAAPDEDLAGRSLGDFNILRRLGEGGMGHVYLARQISLNREVALKFLRPELAANKVSLQRFKKEAESIGRVTHGNIVHIYGIYEVEGLHFMALEFVEGRNLREFMERRRVIDVRTGLNIMGQVASALQRASESGIVHRDIKPENILITKKEEVKVADFGLSRAFVDSGQPHLTQSNVTMGTPLYMSPEQVEGKKSLDQRSDIYSFGVTCYHMFAGQPPFRGESPFEVAVQHVQKEPQPLNEIRPDLPADLVLMIHRMMAKKPEARYQTAGEVARDIGRLRDLIVAMASGTTPAGLVLSRSSAEALQALSGAHAKPRVPWRTYIASLLLGLAILGVGVLAGWWWEYFSPPRPDPALLAESRHKKADDEPKRPLPELRMVVENDLLKALCQVRDKQLDQAEATFDAYAKKKGPQETLAQLGKAMVLAFQSRPEESNKIFSDILNRPKPSPLAWRHPFVLQLIAEALHFNYVNSPKTFPSELDRFRVPPTPTLRAPE